MKAIPASSGHGSGLLQKKLWRLVSDYVRIRDWSKYPYCTATGKPIYHWKEGQAGHFKAYTKCNGMMKFDERNIHLQSYVSNGFGDYDDWVNFETNIKRRYGEEHIRAWNEENLAHMNEKLYDSMIVEKMEDILQKMGELEEYPDYYIRTTTLLLNYKQKLHELQGTN